MFYGADGKLRVTPEFDEVENIAREGEYSGYKCSSSEKNNKSYTR
jgi:hypothetical protein